MMDALKALCIVSVVLSHVTGDVYAILGENVNKNSVYRLALTFQMPLFLFISGYITGFKKDEELGGFKWIERRGGGAYFLI